jgi:hypothetical protein
MKQIIFILLVVITIGACKKNYNATPTYAANSIAGTWAKKQPFYSPGPQIYLETTGIWRNFISFSFTSDAEPDKLGFANPYVAGKGTNVLYVNTLYGSQGISSDSGYYNVTAPKLFQLIPKSTDSLQTGTVVVLPQTLKIFRTNGSSFSIGVGPSTTPGTYSTVTGLIEIEVQFDETDIGGPAVVRRKYRFRS